MRLFICFLALAFSSAHGCRHDDDEPSSVDPSAEQTPDETNSEVDVSDSILDEGNETEQGPVIWTGPRIIFEKENFADFMDAANQDIITDRVVLTRAEENALFNVVLEDISENDSPAGTEWAESTTAEIDELDF